MSRPRVHGETVDGETRCVHYRTPLDVVAIKFRCCGRYYPCYQCHRDAEDHPVQRWPHAEWDTPAILCGVCWSELAISTYRDSTGCPSCNAPFNPGCALHGHLYFSDS